MGAAAAAIRGRDRPGRASERGAGLLRHTRSSSSTSIGSMRPWRSPLAPRWKRRPPPRSRTAWAWAPGRRCACGGSLSPTGTSRTRARLPGPRLPSPPSSNGWALRREEIRWRHCWGFRTRSTAASGTSPGAPRRSLLSRRILESGRGVCQDYTHVMITIARSWGVPARYGLGLPARHRPRRRAGAGDSHPCVGGMPAARSGLGRLRPHQPAARRRTARAHRGRPRLPRRVPYPRRLPGQRGKPARNRRADTPSNKHGENR